MTPALPERPPLPTYNDVRGSFNKYRSIAFGTWKPGEAKRFSEKAKRRAVDSTPKALSEAAAAPARSRRDLPTASDESLDDCPTLVPTEDEVDEISEIDQ